MQEKRVDSAGTRDPRGRRAVRWAPCDNTQASPLPVSPALLGPFARASRPEARPHSSTRAMAHRSPVATFVPRAPRPGAVPGSIRPRIALRVSASEILVVERPLARAAARVVSMAHRRGRIGGRWIPRARWRDKRGLRRRRVRWRRETVPLSHNRASTGRFEGRRGRGGGRCHADLSSILQRRRVLSWRASRRARRASGRGSCRGSPLPRWSRARDSALAPAGGEYRPARARCR